jgi:hypothetical protein
LTKVNIRNTYTPNVYASLYAGLCASFSEFFRNFFFRKFVICENLDQGNFTITSQNPKILNFLLFFNKFLTFPNNSIPFFIYRIVSPSPDNGDWKTGFADNIRQTGSPRVSLLGLSYTLAFHRTLNIRRLVSWLFRILAPRLSPWIRPFVSVPYIFPSYLFPFYTPLRLRLSSMLPLRIRLAFTPFVYSPFVYVWLIGCGRHQTHSFSFTYTPGVSVPAYLDLRASPFGAKAEVPVSPLRGSLEFDIRRYLNEKCRRFLYLRRICPLYMYKYFFCLHFICSFF